jgi:hypothetical protein
MVEDEMIELENQDWWDVRKIDSRFRSQIRDVLDWPIRKDLWLRLETHLLRWMKND